MNRPGRKLIDEFWIVQIVYTVVELASLPTEVRDPIQAKIDSGDYILSAGEISVPLLVYEGERGAEADAAQQEALARANEYARRGYRVKVIANIDAGVA